MSNYTSGLTVRADSICQDRSFDMQHAYVLFVNERVIRILRVSDFVCNIETLLYQKQ
jgi:hypothetical protein